MANPYKIIELSTWPRRGLFESYLRFANPSYTVNVLLEGDRLYRQAHETGDSFFLLTLYALWRSVNEIPELRRRYVDGEIREYERVAVSTPILTEGGEMFREVFCEGASDWSEFRAKAAPLIEAAKRNEPGLEEEGREDFFGASCLPWVHFQSLVPADYSLLEFIPVLTWGKIKDGKIPVSAKFNHCFVDGLHCGRFFEAVERYFQKPDSLY